MPCPTCGCTCQGTIPCPTVFVEDMRFFGEQRLQHVLVVDMAEPERPLAAELEILARRAMCNDDKRPFHQRLNRKPWERRV